MVITTGGAAADPRFNEGGVGHDYLARRGVPDLALIAETQASDTAESADRVAVIMRANQMRLLGVDALPLSRAAVKRRVPLIDLDNGRYPVLGGFLQPRGGTVRHDAVAWAYARAAAAAGVDIVEHCEVQSVKRAGARAIGVETCRGFIAAETVCLAVAGHSSLLAATADVPLPIETHVLQAFVSEPIKPVLDVVLTYGAGHFYLNQSD